MSTDNAMNLYSKETQLAIIEEIIRNQCSTNTIERNTDQIEWNYDYLASQGFIKQEISSSHVFPPTNGTLPSDAMLVGETLTEIGKLWRSELYVHIQNDQRHEDTQTTQNCQNRMTLALQIMTIPSFLHLMYVWFQWILF